MIRDPHEVADIVRGARTIAVVGASIRPEKAGYYVPEYLDEVGYRVVPVNPTHVGMSLWGEEFRSRLVDIEGPVDIIDVFRLSRHVAGHVDDILALDPRPKLVWLQQGIRDDASAARLAANAIDVVQDACLMVQHRIYVRE